MPRHPSIELLRFICAFGWIWNQMLAPGAAFAYASLAVFSILTAFFATARVQSGAPGFLAERARRLMLPWAAWSVVYLLVALARGLEIAMPTPRTLLVGPLFSFWFLPFAFLSAITIAGLAPRIDGRGRTWLATAGFAAIAILLFHWHATTYLHVPFAQWSFAIPSVLYGTLAAAARRSGAWPAPFVFCAVVVPVAMRAEDTNGPIDLLVAVLAFELCARVRFGGAIALSLGRLTYGVYLLYPMATFVIFASLPIAISPGEGAVAVFLLAAAFSAVAGRIPLIRRLV